MIKRVPRKNSFTIINNAILNDDRLDWKELGLLVYLLSKPDNWAVSPAHLVKQRKTGRDGIYAILKKLREVGYVDRKPNPKGGWDWWVSEEPTLSGGSEDECSVSENPYIEHPHAENPESGRTRMRKTPTLISTERDIVNTERDIVNTERDIVNTEERSTTHGVFVNNRKTYKKHCGNKVISEKLGKTDKKETDSLIADRDSRDFLRQALYVAQHLSYRIRKTHPTAKTRPETWAIEIEKALRIDNRTVDDLINVIDYVFLGDGTFWQPNILSGKKLRMKYDTIYLQMNNQNRTQSPIQRVISYSERYISGETKKSTLFDEIRQGAERSKLCS